MYHQRTKVSDSLYLQGRLNMCRLKTCIYFCFSASHTLDIYDVCEYGLKYIYFVGENIGPDVKVLVPDVKVLVPECGKYWSPDVEVLVPGCVKLFQRMLPEKLGTFLGEKKAFG